MNKARLIKDYKKRKKISKKEIYRKFLKNIIKNKKLSNSLRLSASLNLQMFKKQSSLTQITNRCILTGRARGVLKNFKISRNQIYKLSQDKKLPGIIKSSW
jgi:small subunit ribosomal protein S14